MHKKTTLKNFGVWRLKTVIMLFVLGFLFQGTFAQNKTSRPSSQNETKSSQPVSASLKKELSQKVLTTPEDEAALKAKKEIANKTAVNIDARAINKEVSAEPKSKIEVMQEMGSRSSQSSSFTRRNLAANIALSPEKVPSDNSDFNRTYSTSSQGFTNPPTSNIACLFTGSLLAGDLTMPQRLNRPGGTGGSCATPQPFPGPFGTGPYFYDTYTFTNTTGGTACVVVNLTTNDLTNANIQSGAWLGSFNPANMATNYIADPYVSTGTPAPPAGITYSFNLANAATVVIVVWSTNPNTAPSGTANDYTLSVDGLPNLCPQPPCVPSTAAVISALSLLYNQGFDVVSPLPAGWSAQNLSNPVGATGWFQGNSGVFPSHSGAATSYIAANFNNTTGLNIISNWLFGPNVTLRNGDVFSFWTRTTTGAFPDRLQVRMSTSGASTNAGSSNTSVGDFSTLLLDINPTYTATGYPTSWTQFSVSLSGLPAGGVSGRIAFRYFVEGAGPSGSNSDYIGIDDVVYNSVSTPSVCAGGTANLVVNITGGSPPFTVVYTDGTTNYTVNNYTSGSYIPVSPTVPTTYTLVSVAGTGGCLGTGNSGSATVNITPASTAAVLSQVLGPPVPVTVYNETFNTVVPLPAGWASQNLSNPVGLTGWFQGNTGVFPGNTPPGYIAANFNNTTGLNIISNWLFAPNVTLKNGDKFSFYTRTTNGTFPDRLQVRMSTNGASVNAGTTNVSVGDFTTLLLDINPTYTSTGYPTAWTQFTITLSGLPAAGVSGRIAFRYFVEGAGPSGANSDYIGIDDVVYSTVNPGPPPTTCTGSTTNLKVDITGGNGPYTVVINATPGAPGYPRTITNYNSGDYIAVTPPVTTTYNLVSVTSADGCAGTGNSGTPTVTVLPATITPIAIVDNPTGPLCAGDPKLLTVVGAGGAQTFSNPGSILMPANTGTCSGIASPYPATIAVSGLPTSGVNVATVKLINMNHTWAGDLDIVLQSPTGQNVILLSDNGGSSDFINTTLTFDDAAPGLVPTTNPIPSGTYRCTNTAGPDTWPAPGPGTITQINPTLATFTGNMNGTWNLFINDQAGGDCGTMAGGFEITFNTPPAPPPTGWTFLWSPAAGLSSTTTNPVAASPMQTTTYTVIGTAPGGCQTSAAITINVNQLPAVTSNPTNVTACDGSTVTFSVTGTGAGITYQWQVSTNGGASYSNIAPGAPYSGINSPTLTINPVSAAMTTYRYRCVISGTCPPAANSTGAILTVNGLPVIAITPTGPVCGGVPGINGTLITAGSSAPPVPGSVTVNSGNINLAIPDGPATWPQTLFPGVKTPDMAVSGIPANATITGMSVKLNLPHTYIADMVIVLKAPNGQVLNLDANISQTGGPGADFVNTTISSASTTALSSASPPYTGTFKADAVGATYVVLGFTFPGGPTTPAGYIPTVNSFSGLYSQPNGNYSLGIYDWGAGDLGTLTNWELRIDYTTPGGTGNPLTYTWSPAAGLYNDAAATQPYVAGTQTNQVYAAPTVNTVYTITGTDGTTGCKNTGTINVVYTPTPPVISPANPAICLGSIQPLSITSALQPVTTQFCSGPVTVAIPEGNFPAPPATAGVSVIPVSGIPAGAVITRIDVTSNITHAYVGDVVMVLKAPNGQVFNLDALLSATNNPGANFVNTVISSAGTAALSSGTAPFTSTFRADAVGATFTAFGFTLAGGPVGYAPTTTAWSGLYSVPNGNWTLAMYDAGAPDVGTLTSWCLTITYGVPASGIWSPVGGLYSDPAATIPYVAGTVANTVYAKPTPAGVYPYQVTVQSVGFDAFQTFSNTASITINNVGPGTPYPANLAVSGLPTSGATVQSVTLNGMNHTWASDVDILLQSPSGQNVILMSDVGGNVAIPANAVYTFDDAGPAMAAAANPSGTYRPTNLVGTLGVEPDNWPAPGPGTVAQPNPALSMFTGDMNGTWKLFVVDDAAGDAGSINGGFSIRFKYPTPGCTSAPRTVTVTVNQPAAVTTQPVNQTVCTDKVATFTVAASGTPPFTYQWQVSTNNGNTWANVNNGGVYSGATSATLSISGPPVSMSGYFYRCVVQGPAPCPSATSFQAILTVNPLPTIVISPAPYTRLFPGLVTTLSSTVSPAAASTYTWLRNGAAVPGANSGTLNVNVDGLGSYVLRVTDVNGCTNTSNTVNILDSASGKCFIYPNPNTGQFQVRYYSVANNVLPRTLTVYDSKGDRISTQYYSIGRPYDRMDVDLRKNGKGLYWVEIGDLNGNRITMCRVVVQ